MSNSIFGRCLYPPMTCKEAPIRAHTIQNSKVLDKIVDKGHVVGLVRRINKETGPILEFKNIGRNEASTFTGLCSTHDQRLFGPIDNNALDPENKEQLFLLVYRAILRELHATMDGAVKLQSSYQKRIELGLAPGDRPCPEGMLAIERIMVSYETNLYKTMFDESLIKGTFDCVEHKVIILNDQRPTVAASALFSLDKVRIDDDVVRVALNIIPASENQTIVVFSFHKRDARLAKNELNYIFNAHDYYQKYEISRALINYCENYYVSPRYFSEWSEEKKDEIKDYYESTILRNDLDYQNENLYLF